MLTNKKIVNSNLFYNIVIVGSFLLFFIDGPTNYHNRVLLLFWDNGHILFFGSLTTLIHLNYEHDLKYTPYILSFMLAFLLGIIIELIQGEIGRNVDWKDVYLGFLGALLINTCYFAKRKVNTTSLLLLFIAICLILDQQKALFSAIRMEYLINARFPSLATFNSSDDLNSWSGESLTIIKIDRVSTNKILKATLIANQQYTTLTLNNFYKNWSGYHEFSTSLYLEGNDDVKICIRITDMIHDTGSQAYSDRFNYCTLLKPKGNNIIIPVEIIRTSPQSRYLDIKNLSEITFFSMNLSSNIIIYVSDIKLQ
jgi:hypothetical protein